MKSTEFMLGNIVALRGKNVPDIIVSIEVGMVQLGNRNRSDDERDIVGIPLMDWINEQTSGIAGGKLSATIKGIELCFTIKKSDKKAILVFPLIGSLQHEIILVYLHQLQNLIFVLTGQRLSEIQKWNIHD